MRKKKEEMTIKNEEKCMTFRSSAVMKLVSRSE